NIIFGAMVDDRLADQVWVTVVATGFGEPRVRRERPGQDEAVRSSGSRALREPVGEPRISRVRRSAEMDVPEFIPRR
ncbi:MAG: cell division protein FtsZ, partial [Solirubrobacteraceae bacterium]